MDKTILDFLEKVLKSHDWYYVYSDDYRVYAKGQQESIEVSRLMREALDAGFGEEAALLYNNISPHGNTHRFTHGDKITVCSVVDGAYSYEFLTEKEYKEAYS